MRYRYKLNQEIAAIQFKGISITDLIELEYFLRCKPDVVYTDDSKPLLKLKNPDGSTFIAQISDYIIKIAPGNYAILPCQAFNKIYNAYKYTASHEDNLAYSLYVERRRKERT